jgi:hypothetical protein
VQQHGGDDRGEQRDQPLIIPATDESTYSSAMGNRDSGSAIQVKPTSQIRGQSSRSMGVRAAGTNARPSIPKRMRRKVTTPGAKASIPMAISRNEEPQTPAMNASSPHSTVPNAC